MRTWRRASVPTLCGGCGRHVAKGDPLLELTFAGRRQPIRRYRCSLWRCAEEAVPLDLPPLVARTAIPMTPLVHVASGVGTLPLDWKTLGAGAREPGDDDD